MTKTVHSHFLKGEEHLWIHAARLRGLSFQTRLLIIVQSLSVTEEPPPLIAPQWQGSLSFSFRVVCSRGSHGGVCLSLPPAPQTSLPALSLHHYSTGHVHRTLIATGSHFSVFFSLLCFFLLFLNLPLPLDALRPIFIRYFQLVESPLSTHTHTNLLENHTETNSWQCTSKSQFLNNVGPHNER